MKRFKSFLFGFITALMLIVYPLYSFMPAQGINAYASETFCIPASPKAVCSEEYEREVLLDVPFISQLENYPNGCEAVSTVSLLQYSGFDITVDDFIDNLLPMGAKPELGGIGPDPEKVYCGDPRSKNGWGCYSSVIASVLDEYLYESGYTYNHSYTYSLQELCQTYIDRGIPVIVWATVGMVDSSDMYAHWYTEEGKEISYNRKLHCLVLTGYDSDNYYFNDPMVGKNIPYSKASAQKAFEILGMQSIAVIKR